MADLQRGFRTTQNLKRFSYGPQPVSAPAIAYSGTWAPLNSPHFTGDPQAPTPPTPDNDTSIATTAFVKNQNYAPLASPTFTGDPKAPTPSPGDADTSIATTAFVGAAITAAPNKTITLSGDISGAGTAAITTTLPNVNANVGTFQGLTVNAKGQVTAAANQSYLTGITSGQVTTALGYTPLRPSLNLSDVANAATALGNLAGAPLASPTFTGTPTLPTGTIGVTQVVANNTTALATTAFVKSQNYVTGGPYLPLTGGALSGSTGLTLPQGVFYYEMNVAGSTQLQMMVINGTNDMVMGNNVPGQFYVGCGTGVVVGAAAGGAKGAGTVNAVTVYAGGVALTSDARLKTDIAPLPDDCISLVAAIEPKTFRRVRDAPRPIDLVSPALAPDRFYERRNWGFVAQEVKAAMDAAGHEFGGHYDEDGVQSLSYNDLVSVLWRAVQELSAKVTALEMSSR